MKKDIPEIELFISDEKEEGVFAISLVENPAIESNFLALSEESESKFTLQLKEVDKKRNIVVGYALIPEIRIPRIKDGKQFNIFLSKETVAKAAALYMKQLNLQNVTSEHEKPVKDCCVVQSWIIEDPKNDKANIYNLDPKPQGGEWVVMMALSEEEYSKVEDGIYKGFSIEALFDGFDKLEQSKEDSDEELFRKIRQILEAK